LISRHRAAAAEASNGIASGIQSSDRIRCRIERRRIGHTGTTRPRVTRSYHHLDTSSFLGLNRDSQFVPRDASFRGRATPGVDGNVGRQSWIALVRRAVEWIRREEKFHALDVPCRCAVAYVHVTATDPFCPGRHSNLISAAIIANRCASCVGAVEEIIARLLRIVPARIAHTVMNGVVPVKVVIGVDSVPPTVVRLERVMCPALTRIGAGNNDSLASESQRPHVRRVRVSNARFDRRRNTGCAGHQRRLLNGAQLRKVIVNNRVACDTRHVWTSCQRFGKLAVSFHQNCINDIERLILNLSFAQPLKDWPLSALGLFQQGLINEAALFGLSWQIGRRTQIGLIC